MTLGCLINETLWYRRDGRDLVVLYRSQAAARRAARQVQFAHRAVRVTGRVLRVLGWY